MTPNAAKVAAVVVVVAKVAATERVVMATDVITVRKATTVLPVRKHDAGSSEDRTRKINRCLLLVRVEDKVELLLVEVGSGYADADRVAEGETAVTALAPELVVAFVELIEIVVEVA